ncbi:puromycin-sensitive aminopeptidase [Protopterus annectens]|uniref:puromycin-sensitive aminopeptidase n=1 Tax=Protopterus annectens TaxID=7888 RepID=UPI001CF956B6|nr:puromycin-sensitive aminopeptidase [Protopterus annectens]
MPEKKPFERLPTTVIPINYGLSLKPDLIDLTFEGKLEASVKVEIATSQVVMNCADIDIITASFTPEGGEEIQATGFNYQNEDEKVTLSFPSSLRKGPGTLKIDFVGELNDKMKGFYRSKYTTPSGDVRIAAVTQFEVAAKTIPFYNDYFLVPYPLPKIDLIAIADFAAGAMENWGLVTYRETALLIDPKNSCSSSRQWVALVVGHELAHQWFGNLVTMEWWTHLWLNEGFASWIEYLCVDHCFPEYDIWTQFVSSDYTRALELDALNNSHPIEVNVGHPSEVDEIFDAISYSKGASVIRMLHDYIGDADFRLGMKLYLTKFQHRNAKTEDLWASLEEASKKPIGAMMSTWTKQMGFPLICVKEEQHGDNRVLTLTQKKFCAGGPFTGNDGPLWMIPVAISTSEAPSSAKITVMLDERTKTVELKNVKPEEWVKLNPGTLGFYRVQYSSEMLERLLPGIRNLSLLPVDRLSLQNDLFSLARAGLVSTVEALKVMEAFVNEPNYTVWSDLSCNLGTLSTLLSNTEFQDEILDFIRDLFEPIGSKLGWDPKEGEGHMEELLRSLVLQKLGNAGHSATLNEHRAEFTQHYFGKTFNYIMSSDTQTPVYVTVLKHGDAAILDAMLKLHKQADMSEERNRIERVLGAIPVPELIEKVLTFALSEEVRPQDTVSVIGGVAGGSMHGKRAAWNFLQQNWDELHSRYQGGFLMARLIKLTVEGFAVEKMASEVKDFFDVHEAPSAERAIQQCCENILLNAAWLKRDANDIQLYLKQRKLSTPPTTEK